MRTVRSVETFTIPESAHRIRSGFCRVPVVPYVAGIREDGPCHPRAVVWESTVHCEVINAHTLTCILFRRLRPSETHKLLDLRRTAACAGAAAVSSSRHVQHDQSVSV